VLVVLFLCDLPTFRAEHGPIYIVGGEKTTASAVTSPRQTDPRSLWFPPPDHPIFLTPRCRHASVRAQGGAPACDRWLSAACRPGKADPGAGQSARGSDTGPSADGPGGLRPGVGGRVFAG